MAHTSSFRTRALAAVAAGALLLLGGLVAPAQADTSPTNPADSRTPVTVSPDGLPTVQINGVVWSQVVVGNVVYVAGKFTSARPAGSPAGTNEVPRHNILAYDIETGQLLPFAPVLDNQAMAITASPDGRRVYVVGDFNKVNGQWRVRAAAFDTSTAAVNSASGGLIAGFRPTLNTRGLAVAASNSTVYIGGNFVSAASVTGGALQPRSYLASFAASDGTLQPFLANANAPVTALTLTGNTSNQSPAKLVVGGRFTTLSGTSAYGLGWVDPVSGASSAFPANSAIRNAGNASSITSLYADSSGVYGSGYHFGGGGNLEGSFRADAGTGALIWVADCHGDTYSVFPVGDALYTASHSHYCGNMGGFPQTEPWTFYRGTAFSKNATGVNTADIYGYPDHRGRPAPSILNWYPQIDAGTFTGQSQGPWSVAGNSRYVVFGGEFPRVNGVAQQGLVRFAVKEVTPGNNRLGPQNSGNAFALSASSPSAGTVNLSWPANWDRDNLTLTYRVFRGSTLVNEQKLAAPFWTLPTMRFTDTPVPAGTYDYRVVARDAFGNELATNTVSVTVASGGGGNPPPPPPTGDLAVDAFDRTVTGGWGAASTGGPWTVSGTTSMYGVSNGLGQHLHPRAGATLSTYLNGVSSTSTDLQVTISTNKKPAGGNLYLSVIGRRVGSVDYRASLTVLPSGPVALKVGTASTTIQSLNVPGMAYNQGDQLRVRLQVNGTSPTTVRAKVWKVGGLEPTGWQVSGTDSTAGLQSAGGLGLTSYTSGSSTTAPVSITFDDLRATRVG
jgi:large repetitive protein